jgi:hypothetical protein
MADLLGPPPVITGELASDYDELLERIREVLRPRDIVEEMWVRDVADDAWTIRRCRREKANLLQANAYSGLERVLAPLMPNALEAQDLSCRWAKRDPVAVAEAEQLLKSAHLTMDAVMAETSVWKSRELERLERTIDSAEVARGRAFRDLAYYRQMSAAWAKDVRKKVEDAEYEDVVPPPAGAKART